MTPANAINGASSIIRAILRALIVLPISFTLPAMIGSAATVGASEPADGEAPVIDAAHVYCTVCGSQNKAGSRFCGQDGSPLPEVVLDRRVPGFVRAAETYSSGTIQRTIDRASQSVVRIHARIEEKIYIPVARMSRRPGYSMGYLETMDVGDEMAGSGFVISSTGEVVTNAHVAAPLGARAKLTVETRDGRSYGARIVGVDVASDLALLRIDTHSIPPLTITDEKRLHLGEETWAIGNPLDIGISVTRGTISSIGRMRMGMNQVESYVHSDAYITHGNSGGPLVNVLGEVVGVSAVGYHEEKGQGYSIPSSMARLVVEHLRGEGIYRRGFLGLHVSSIGPKAIEEFSLKRTRGMVVESVLKGSPAERAGFRRGDVVFGIDGKFVPAVYLMQEAVSIAGPGTPVRIAQDRDGEAGEVVLKTMLRPPHARIDPVLHFELMLGGRFEQGPDGEGIIFRAPDPFSIARHYGLGDGAHIQKVYPAQDWKRDRDEAPGAKKKRGSRKESPGVEVHSLDDLRAALKRAYLGGRMAATFILDMGRPVGVTVGFDEDCPAII